MAVVDFIHTQRSFVTKIMNRRPIARVPIEPCGMLGFQYDHRPKLGDKSDAKHVTNPSPAINGQVIACLSCGEPIGPNSCEPDGGWAS